MRKKVYVVYYELDGRRGSVMVDAENKQLAREELIGAEDSVILDGLLDRYQLDKYEVDFSKLIIQSIELEEV